MTAAVVLSPHPDDAVLSCWHALATTGRVTVINVFAAIPDPAQPVAWWDRVTGATSSAERMRERLAEDRRALALAGRRAINLNFLDYQYRDRQQTLDQVVDELRHHLAPGTAILAPAGIGGHPDHLHVRAAAMRLRDDHAVALYAELPHAIRHGWPRIAHSGSRPAPVGSAEMDWEQPLAQVNRALCAPTVHSLPARALAAKINAIRAYRSQLAALNTMAYQPLDGPDTLRYEVAWQVL